LCGLADKKVLITCICGGGKVVMGLLVKKPTRQIWNGIFLFILFGGLVCPIPSANECDLQAAPAPVKDPEVLQKAEVSITTDQQMDFGQLADKDGSVTLGLGDSIIADPNYIHYGGSPYSGIYTLTGDPSTAVDISVAAISGNGFTLSSFVSSEGAIPLIGVLLDPSGELVLTVGATLTLDASTAVIGSGQNISFTIISTYN
jgi:hypothetical protein